jgi:hypothetical protein
MKIFMNLETGESSVEPCDDEMAEALSTDFEGVFGVPVIHISIPGTSENLRIIPKVSTASQNSSMSPELAEKLGLAVRGIVNASGFRVWAFDAGLPATYVMVETAVTVAGRAALHRCKVVPLIVAACTGMLVLGKDWLNSFGNAFLVSSPSKVFIYNNLLKLLLPMPWSYSDKSSQYNPQSMDLSHLVNV